MLAKSLIAAASFVPNLLESPSAWLGHMPLARWLTQETAPRLFVELGSHYGHSYFSFCQSVVECGLPTKCYAVDTWQGDEHAGQYAEDVYGKVASHNEKHFAGFSNLLRMSFDQAQATFDDASIDLLHIDGLHTYEAVRHDFETWLPKLAPGAVVLFHDISVSDRNFEVWKFWDELKLQYPAHCEFSHSFGLGVMQLNNAPQDKKLSWLDGDDSDKAQLATFFAALGGRQFERFEASRAATELHTTLRRRDGQIATLNAQLTAVATQFKASLSWRVTTPLRFVLQSLQGVLGPAAAVVNTVQRLGGVKDAVSATMQLYRTEGARSLLRGICEAVFPRNIFPARGSGSFDRNDYTEWLRRYDSLTDEVRHTMRKTLASWSDTPLISVIMPSYNPNPKWLVEAIESVRNQIYPNWELCVADDASTDITIRPIFEQYAKDDARIKVVCREQNGHISAASNSALQMATGKWVALLDHDDLLSEHALYWVVDAINKRPDARLIYSDEDKLNEAGRRVLPLFKCDWNRDLFYSYNMISHLGVYHAELVKELGGFSVGMEGSQDYDLALRCIECIKPTQIHHIPRILYHWRIHPESTAQSPTTKPYAMVAGEKALNAHFERLRIAARAEFVGLGYRIHYALPAILPLVSLIMPTRNGLQLLQRSVESIFAKTTYANYELLIVDNGSDDIDTLHYLASLGADSRVRVIRDDHAFNYSALNNAAARVAKGELLCLINNDIAVISPDWLSEMVAIALLDDVGAVGARLWYPDNTLQHGGVLLGVGGVANHAHLGLRRDKFGYFGRAGLRQSFSAVTGACLLVRKAIYDQVGGLNENDLAIAFNDVDFCLRVREAGYRNVWTPYAELYHYESATRGIEDTSEKRARFASEVQYMQRRWNGLLLQDPAYSPNLTLELHDFSLAWPPRIATAGTAVSTGFCDHECTAGQSYRKGFVHGGQARPGAGDWAQP